MSKNQKILIISISVSLIILLVFFLCCNIFVSYKKQEKQKALIEKYRQEKIETYQQENKIFNDFEVDVAFLGDSLTEGYNLEQYYPNQITTNRGIAGDTTFNLEKRLQVSVYDLKPKVVVMLIGGNNLKTMFKNYENIVKGLTTNLPESKIVLLSLTAMSGNWGKNNNLAKTNNEKIAQIATVYNCTYVDLFNPLFDTNSNGIYSEYTTDGAHLTSIGYEVITRIISPVLNTLLS